MKSIFGLFASGFETSGVLYLIKQSKLIVLIIMQSYMVFFKMYRMMFFTIRALPFIVRSLNFQACKHAVIVWVIILPMS